MVLSAPLQAVIQSSLPCLVSEAALVSGYCCSQSHVTMCVRRHGQLATVWLTCSALICRSRYASRSPVRDAYRRHGEEDRPRRAPELQLPRNLQPPQRQDEYRYFELCSPQMPRLLQCSEQLQSDASSAPVHRQTCRSCLSIVNHCVSSSCSFASCMHACASNF